MIVSYLFQDVLVSIAYCNGKWFGIIAQKIPTRMCETFRSLNDL